MVGNEVSVLKSIFPVKRYITNITVNIYVSLVMLDIALLSSPWYSYEGECIENDVFINEGITLSFSISTGYKMKVIVWDDFGNCESFVLSADEVRNYTGGVGGTHLHVVYAIDKV